MSERVREYIERCKQKLIDLSRRNRLLYFTPRKKTSLEVIHPDAISLFNQLVLDGKSLEIWLPPEERLNTSDQSDSREDVLGGEEIKNLNIKKNQLVCSLKDRDELEQTLKNIYRRATSDYRERGLRTLYVAFGILTWREIDTSENVHSPLVLVPVELKRESIRYPFTLYPIDEDVVINPALKLRLQRDFKVDLPEAPDEWGETDLINFFDSIKKIIDGTPWSIDHAVYIAIFSFYKLVMYDDLDANIEIVSSNSMVSSLGEGTLREDLIINDLPDEKELDTIQQSIDTLQILDADSSQQLCIQHALRGQSFIIQGPPGTGKSQTIANIISEFVARGKKVLFVSEKMAALEVVYKRLKAAGLSDFCLELHSHKADKHEVISDSMM